MFPAALCIKMLSEVDLFPYCTEEMISFVLHFLVITALHT